MDLINTATDHPKEYYYKITSNNRKLYYHRTPNGHKVIAKAKIPVHFLDRIKPYNSVKDLDWLRQKENVTKKLEETINRLKNLDKLGLSQKNYDRSVRVLEDRIKSYTNCIKYCENANDRASEERYKEEMRQYGGFKNYFKQKYKKSEHNSYKKSFSVAEYNA